MRFGPGWRTQRTLGAIWLGFGLMVSFAWPAPKAYGQSDDGQSTLSLRLVDPARPEPSPTVAEPVRPAAESPPSAGMIVTRPAAPSLPTRTLSVEPTTLQPAPAIVPEKAIAAPGPRANEPLKPIPAEAGPVEIEPASFKGIAPGTNTLADLQKGWGRSKQVRIQGKDEIHQYSIEPFSRVEAIITNDKVTSILIWLDKSFPVNAVAGQLGLAKVRPVLVSNELGEILGQSYPERGVFLSFEPAPERGKVSNKVAQIVLEPIGPEPFLLRAETGLESEPNKSLADLDQCVKLQPKTARAHWLRARALVVLGQPERALAAVDEAVRLEGKNGQYLVTRAQLLGQAGRLAEATADAEKAITLTENRPHIKARATCLLGDLAASAAPPDYRQAISHHMSAIQLADAISTDPHPAIRIPGKEVLIDAHLGAAHDIGWGTWKDKEKAMARWLDRATFLADDLVNKEGAGAAHQLRVAGRALAACVGARGAVDPRPYADMAARVADQLIKGTDDSVQKAQVRWDAGMALYDALQICQIRGEHDTALKYGQVAIAYLEDGRPKDSASADYLLGRLYFRMGAVYALRDQNHRQATAWFQKAIPFLEKPLPTEAAGDLGRHGETFVSMGVSFWEAGKQDRGLELTQQGVQLMERAVRQNLLDPGALSVAYGNLASMHRSLGRADSADRLEEMASRSKRSLQR